MLLAQLLASLPFATVAAVRPVLFELTESSSGMKGADERDMFFGRLFGIAALVRSGLVARPATTEADYDALIGALHKLRDRKTYLRELATEVLTDVVAVLGQRASAPATAAPRSKKGKAAAVPATDFATAVCERLLATVGPLPDSPEKLATVLAVQQAFPVCTRATRDLEMWLRLRQLW